MTKEEIRQDFHNEHGISWVNSQGEPDIDYVEWLEKKILACKSSRFEQSNTLLTCPNCKDYYGIDINHRCFNCGHKYF